MSIGKKLSIGLAVAAVAIMALAPVAMAAIANSNHDMYAVDNSISPRSGACSFCHIPHRALGDKLWPSVPIVGGGWRAEIISQLCWSCHGTGTTFGTALQLNPFQADQHLQNSANLIGWGDIGAMPGDVEMSEASPTLLKCTSCHDVHNNDNRPFIRYESVVGSFNYDEHCVHCHVNRKPLAAANQATANVVNGVSQHPTGQSLSDTGVAGANPMIAVIDAAFGTSPGTANNPIEPGYNLGGHRNDGTAGGEMTCATCHATHGNETGAYAAADGATPVPAAQAAFNHLLVIDDTPLLTVAICNGCHTNDPTAGPGAAGTFSHPIDTASNVWGIIDVNLGPGVGNQWGTDGTNDVIVCLSCHDMHYGVQNTSILAGAIDAPAATSNANCGECHGATSTMPNHHPAGVSVISGTDYVAAAATRTTGDDWTARTRGTAGPVYQFPGGFMTCGTCHGNASTAHNNTQWPGLAGVNTCSEMCADCHSYNPSAYTDSSCQGPAPAGADTTHYVGAVASAGYVRAAAWGSGASSIFCNAGSEIICESCHTLKLPRSGVTPAVSSNSTGDDSALQASVGLLVNVSGNDMNVFDSSGASPPTGTEDMCTGCHGSSGVSGTGTTATHPVLANDGGTAASAEVIAKIATAPLTVSLSSANRVNCESCHRPHDAANGSGAIILEGAGAASVKTTWDRAGGGVYTDEMDFCNMCHSF